jgi:cytochrome c oxidase subunit 1
MYGGKIRFDTPMLFCIAFLFQFLIAGLTGVMLAAAPFDWQLTDSYFVVAHFHYVLWADCCSHLFGAIYYWFPKATGRMLSETLGKWHFWLLVIGFHMTFDPLHFAGLSGDAATHLHLCRGPRLGGLNLLASIGVIFQAAAVACLIWNIVRSLRSGALAGNDPWDAWTSGMGHLVAAA